MCVELGCTEGCAEEMGAGVGDVDWMAPVKFPDGLRSVKASLYPAALQEFHMVHYE